MAFPQITLTFVSILILFLFYTSPATEAAEAQYQTCAAGNYTTNSTYAINLQTLFAILTKSATNSTTNFGFAKNYVGTIPNLISGLVLCRGDVNLSTCASCLMEATQDVQNICPYSKGSTIYYDLCLLRYSNQNFLSSMDNTNRFTNHLPQTVNVSFTRFDNLVYYLLSSTAYYAAFNNSKKLGTSQMNTDDTFPVIRGLVQCTPDMSSTICMSCLQELNNQMQQMPNYFSGRRGGRIVGFRCYIRYRTYPFYDGAAMLMLTPPAENAPAPASRLPPQVTQSPDLAAQCTPDLSRSTCRSCLQDMIYQMPKYFNGRQGGRMLGVRCNFRFESFSFYEGAALLTVVPQFNVNALVPAPAPTVAPAAVINSVPQGEKKTSTGKVLEISIPLVLAFIAIAGLYACFLKRKKSALTKPLMNIGDTEEIKSVESLLLSISVLRVATINFAEENKLGEGGFGAVYKGVLPDGREIAVKRLSERSSQGLYELKNELLLLAKLQHKNLVRLIGVCLEGQEKMLVYEYIRNKSLDQILFDTEKQHLLDWARRYKIICGIARGLLYLHEDSQHRIIHRDLKASNVLLDEGMNPKISDFGMARLFLEDQTQAVTRHVVGTFGYIAPEYAAHGHFSIKSDVFSYGVLLLEIITGKKSNSTFENEDIIGLSNFVWKHWTDGTITEVADPLLGQQYPISELLRCTQIALLCVQNNPTDRPTMSNVIVMLSSETVSLQAPSRPAFCNASSGMRADSSSSGFNSSEGITDRSSSKSVPTSQNEVSITDIEPR